MTQRVAEVVRAAYEHRGPVRGDDAGVAPTEQIGRDDWLVFFIVRTHFLELQPHIPFPTGETAILHHYSAD